MIYRHCSVLASPGDGWMISTAPLLPAALHCIAFLELKVLHPKRFLPRLDDLTQYLLFLLPSFYIQQYLKPGDGPIVLVLAPTRELAVQIKEECDKFGASSEIKNTVVYGGVPKSRQVRDLKNGVEIVIATPVRILHFMT
jgi:hypothetical protein